MDYVKTGSYWTRHRGGKLDRFTKQWKPEDDKYNQVISMYCIMLFVFLLGAGGLMFVSLDKLPELNSYLLVKCNKISTEVSDYPCCRASECSCRQSNATITCLSDYSPSDLGSNVPCHLDQQCSNSTGGLSPRQSCVTSCTTCSKVRYQIRLVPGNSFARRQIKEIPEIYTTGGYCGSDLGCVHHPFNDGVCGFNLKIKTLDNPFNRKYPTGIDVTAMVCSVVFIILALFCVVLLAVFIGSTKIQKMFTGAPEPETIDL